MEAYTIAWIPGHVCKAASGVKGFTKHDAVTIARKSCVLRGHLYFNIEVPSNLLIRVVEIVSCIPDIAAA
jgi:hypothetical protein